MNPFGPLSVKPQGDWDAADHQRAANYYFFERQGATEELQGPNYKPLWSGMNAAYEYHTRRAKVLRAAKAAEAMTCKR